MIIVLDKSATPEQIAQITSKLEQGGYQSHPIYGVEKTVIGAVGVPEEEKPNLVEQFEALPFVERVITILAPYKLAAKAYRPEGTVVHVADKLAIGGQRVCIMAGPCTVETYEQTMATARAVKEAGAHMLRGGAYKPSTSPYSFQGLGIEGLKILAEARAVTGLPVVTEVMDPRNVELVCQYADMLQIGTRNMQNYDLLREVGKTRHPVLLKRGMWARIDEWLMAAEYIMKGGNENVVLCERGIRTFETATRNTLDLSAVPLVKQESHLPVIVDPSQGTGKWSLVGAMSRAAVAAGADGLIIEVHPHPEQAWKDGAQSLTFENFRQVMAEVKAIAAAMGKKI